MAASKLKSSGARRKISIRTKLMALCAVLLLTVIGLLGYLSVRTASHNLVEKTQEALELFAGSGADQIEAQLQRHQEVVAETASSETMRSLDWAKQKELLEVKLEVSEYTGLGVVDGDGQAQYASGATADLTGRDYVEKALNGETAISSVLISRVTGEPVIMVAAPIRDANGDVKQALIARASYDMLSNITSRIKFGERGYAYMVDSTGTVMAHDNVELVKTQNNFVKAAKTDERMEDLARLVKRMTSEEQGVGHYWFEGSIRYAGFAPVEGTDWYFAAATYNDAIVEEQIAIWKAVGGGAAVVLLLGLVAAWIMANRIVKPIDRANALMSEVAEGKGDLTRRLDDDGNDEVAELSRSFNKFIERLEGIVIQVSVAANSTRDGAGQLSQAANEVGSHSEHISQSASEISDSVRRTSESLENSRANVDELNEAVEAVAQGAQEQAAKLENGTRSLEDLNQAIAKVAQHARDADGAATLTAEAASEGSRSATNTVEGMGRISEATRSASEYIGQLGQASEEIGSIVEAIEDIAEQTNLLALNAAIEAARAGESGRGFAVVADEVRKLAENAGIQTKNISELIAKVQELTTGAVNAMDQGSTEVESGQELAGRAREALEKIAESINASSREIQAVSSAAASMDTMSRSVTEEMTSLAAITEETSASAEEMAASSQQVAAQIADSTQMSAKQAEDATKVSSATDEANRIVAEMTGNSENLSRMALDLAVLVGQFKTREGRAEDTRYVADESDPNYRARAEALETAADKPAGQRRYGDQSAPPSSGSGKKAA
jgi:methyl-accepting chemotaxis protein